MLSVVGRSGRVGQAQRGISGPPPEPPSGWLHSVSVEENGWVLQVEGEWPASSFSSFNLDPSLAPRITVATSSSGHGRVNGNEAQAQAARPRAVIVGTMPLRRPWPNDSQLDETDLGGGIRRVRIALSNYIYPADPVTVTFAVGWRSGLDGATAPVTNNSTHTKPLPIVRWVVPTNMRHTEAFDLEVLVAAHEPEGLQAVAAVRFVCTDGSTTLTQWATLSASTQFGDGLRCWRATMNPVGLNPGLITCHWEVYPWVGAMRTSGTAHATDTLAGYSTAAERPLMVAWDPAGTRYAPAHVFVDPATGSSSPDANMVYSSLAAAKAGNRAANPSVAMQALYLANRSLSAANGFPARSRALDNGIITLAAGTHSTGAQSVTSGVTCEEARLIVQGDPDDPDPRANCIWEAGQTPTLRGNLSLGRHMTFAKGGATFFGTSAVRRWTFIDCLITGKAGSATATNNFVSSGPPLGEYQFDLFQCRWWKYGVGIGGAATRRVGIARNVEFARSCYAHAVVNAVRIDDADAPVESRSGIGMVVAVGDDAGAEDCIVWNVASWRQDGATGFEIPSAQIGVSPSNPTIQRRFAMVNVLIEKVGSGRTSDAFYASAGNVVTYDCIMDGCTIVGQRINWGYDQPSDNETPMPKIGNVRRNIHVDRMAIKGDQEVPQNSRTANWSEMYMVAGEGSTFMNRVTGAGFLHEFYGVRSTLDPVTAATPGPGVNDGWPQFAADRSQFSGGATDGGGDYRPTIASPLRAFGSNPRCIRSTCDTYRDGTPKDQAGFTAGSERPA